MSRVTVIQNGDTRTYRYDSVPMWNRAYFTHPIDLSSFSPSASHFSFEVEPVGDGVIETTTVWTFQVSANKSLFSTITGSTTTHTNGVGMTQSVTLPPVGHLRAQLTTPNTSTDTVYSTVYITLTRQT